MDCPYSVRCDVRMLLTRSSKDPSASVRQRRTERVVDDTRSKKPRGGDFAEQYKSVSFGGKVCSYLVTLPVGSLCDIQTVLQFSHGVAVLALVQIMPMMPVVVMQHPQIGSHSGMQGVQEFEQSVKAASQKIWRMLMVMISGPDLQFRNNHGKNKGLIVGGWTL